MWPLIGGIAAGVGAVGGAIANSNSNAKDREFQLAMFRRNAALQREFAQHGLRWKMEDAQRAGLHPLIGAGAQAQSFAPISVGSSPDYSMGNAMSDMGQNIGRAISSTSTEAERKISELSIKSLEEDVIHKQLQNSILRQNSLVGPSMPIGNNSFIPGQGGSNSLILDQAMKRVTGKSGMGHMEPGAITGVGHEYLADGSAVPIPSSDVKERIEDNWIHELRHFILNNIAPWFGNENSKPGPGWTWSSKNLGSWQPPGKKYKGHMPSTFAPFGRYKPTKK